MAFYSHTGIFFLESIIPGGSVGAISTAILVVNNLRDINNDRACGKKTLAVYLGERFTKVEYLFLITSAYIIPIYISYIMGNKSSIYIVYFTLPISIRLILEIFFQKGANLNKTLEQTAKLLLLYTILFSFGIIV